MSSSARPWGSTAPGRVGSSMGINGATAQREPWLIHGDQRSHGSSMGTHDFTLSPDQKPPPCFCPPLKLPQYVSILSFNPNTRT